MWTRTGLNLALAVVGVALGSLLFLRSSPEIEPPRLSDLRTDAVRSIRIARPGRAPVELRLEAGHWRLVKPLAAPANPGRARALAEIVEAESFAQIDPREFGLGRFGLDRPLATLVVNAEPLAFGDLEPLRGRRYVQLGSTIHLVSDHFFHLVSASVTSFVHANPLGPDPDPTEFVLPKRTIRRGPGGWTVIPPLAESGSEDAVRAFLDGWRRAQALIVAEYDPERPKGETVTVRLRDRDAAVQLEISRRDQTIVLGHRGLGVEYHFRHDVGARLIALREASSDRAAG